MAVDLGHGLAGVGRGRGEIDRHRPVNDPAVHGQRAISQNARLHAPPAGGRKKRMQIGFGLVARNAHNADRAARRGGQRCDGLRHGSFLLKKTN